MDDYQPAFTTTPESVLADVVPADVISVQLEFRVCLRF